MCRASSSRSRRSSPLEDASSEPAYQLQMEAPLVSSKSAWRFQVRVIAGAGRCLIRFADRFRRGRRPTWERSRAFYVETLGGAGRARAGGVLGRETCFGIWEPESFGGTFAPRRMRTSRCMSTTWRCARGARGERCELHRCHPRHRVCHMAFSPIPDGNEPDAAQPVRPTELMHVEAGGFRDRADAGRPRAVRVLPRRARPAEREHTAGEVEAPNVTLSFWNPTDQGHEFEQNTRVRTSCGRRRGSSGRAAEQGGRVLRRRHVRLRGVPHGVLQGPRRQHGHPAQPLCAQGTS